MRNRCGTFLLTLSRVLFLALIVFAAFNFGLTRLSGMAAFNVAMGATVAIWILAHMVGFALPRTGWIPWVLGLLILLLGWCVTGLGLYENWADEHEIELSEQLLDLILEFGSLDPDLGLKACIRTTVLLGALLIAIDLWNTPRWCQALMATMLATAVAMVTLFYLQKLLPGVFTLRSENGKFPLSFATYRYWGNGASFINLFWPVIAATALATRLHGKRGWSIWMAAAIVVFSANYINVSKAGYGLGLIGLIAFGFLSLFAIRRQRRSRNAGGFSLRTLVVVAIPAAVLAIGLYMSISWERIEKLEKTGLEENTRTQAYLEFLEMIPEAGWTGFGPGSFYYSHYQYIEDNKIANSAPYWVAHQDYLQTVVEWGYAGSILWGLLLVPAALRLGIDGLARKSSRQASDSNEEFEYAYGIVGALKQFAKTIPTGREFTVRGGVFIAIALISLHATIDFPMQIVSLQFFFLIWIALGWARREAVESRDERRETRGF